MVTEELGYALVNVGRREEALEYCDRASLVTGYHDAWINLRDKILNHKKVRLKGRE